LICGDAHERGAAAEATVGTAAQSTTKAARRRPIRVNIVRRRRRLYGERVELEITPEPSDAEREAILAALGQAEDDPEPPLELAEEPADEE
jgi:hypothetical protein